MAMPAIEVLDFIKEIIQNEGSGVWVFIDDGGLQLQTEGGNYLEIGGEPLDEDDQ